MLNWVSMVLLVVQNVQLTYFMLQIRADSRNQRRTRGVVDSRAQSADAHAHVARTAHGGVDSREQELVELTTIRALITSISSC